MLFIVFDIYYNLYLTCMLNTLKFTIRPSAHLQILLVFKYLCFTR